MNESHETGEARIDEAPVGATSVEGGKNSSVGHSLLAFLKEIVIVVSLAVVLSLVAKTFLVQTFWIPSESMMNTLVKDDRVLVSKLTPGPFDLKRGDIVVFEDPGHWLDQSNVPERPKTGLGGSINSALTWVGLLPEDKGNHLIKRVIGLPGDHVTCCTVQGQVSVNGEPIDEPYLHPGDRPSEVEFDAVVPPGRLWVMGDHRSRSADSRYQVGDGTPGEVGSVPIDKVVGRAFTIVWPLNRLAWLGEPQDTFAGVPAPAQAPEKDGATAPTEPQ